VRVSATGTDDVDDSETIVDANMYSRQLSWHAGVTARVEISLRYADNRHASMHFKHQ